MTQKEAIYCELLVLRCKRGQKQALEELVRLWEKRLFYYVRRLVENEETAWLVLQETWVKVLKGIGSLREPRKLPAWLYSIARNSAMSHLRAEYARKDLFENGQNGAPTEEDPATLGFDNAEQVHYALRKLSLLHREVLTLFFLQDLAVEDIAEMLNIPSGTVKSRLYHAKRTLRAMLETE